MSGVDQLCPTWEPMLLMLHVIRNHLPLAVSDMLGCCSMPQCYLKEIEIGCAHTLLV